MKRKTTARVVIVLLLFAVAFFLTKSEQGVCQTCSEPMTCVHDTLSFPDECPAGALMTFYYQKHPETDSGSYGGSDYGRNTSFSVEVPCQKGYNCSWPVEVPYEAVWIRMHDHEGELEWASHIQYDGAQWVGPTQSDRVRTTGSECMEPCSLNGFPIHPPGDTGCPDPMVDPFPGEGWWTIDDVESGWADRDHVPPCAFSYEPNQIIDLSPYDYVEKVEWRFSESSEDHVHVYDTVFLVCQLATLTLDPDSATNVLPDTDHTFTATVVYPTGDPAVGELVSFSTDFGTFENGDQYTEVATDANGEASVTISSSFAGTANIRAWVDDSDDAYEAATETVTDTSTKEWEGPDLTLDPDSATNTLPDETDHTFTATVLYQNGDPAVGEVVSFSTDFGTFENGSQYIEVTTDSNGEADVTVSSIFVGIAEIRAWIDRDDDDAYTTGEVTDTPSTKEWDGHGPTGLDISATADIALERAYDWTVNKSVTPTTLDLASGESGNIVYTIEVTRSLDEDTYTVQGTITAQNTGQNPAYIELVESAIECRVAGTWTEIARITVDQPGILPYARIVGVGNTTTWNFSISFNPVDEATAYRNTSHVMLENSSAGGTVYKPRVSLDLPDTPSSEKDACATVTDVPAIPTGFSFTSDYPNDGWDVCSPDIFIINATVTNNNAGPGTYYLDNTATATEKDTGDTDGEDDARVTITVLQVTPTPAPTPTPFWTVDDGIEAVSYMHIHFDPASDPDPDQWDYYPHEVAPYPYQMGHGFAFGVEVTNPPQMCFHQNGTDCYDPDSFEWVEWRIDRVADNEGQEVASRTDWVPYARAHSYRSRNWNTSEYAHVLAHLDEGAECERDLCVFLESEPGVYTFEGTVVLEARWDSVGPSPYIKVYEVEVSGMIDYMPPASLPENN